MLLKIGCQPERLRAVGRCEQRRGAVRIVSPVKWLFHSGGLSAPDLSAFPAVKMGRLSDHAFRGFHHRF